MVGSFKCLQIRVSILLGGFVIAKIDYVCFLLAKSLGGHSFGMHVLRY